MNSLVSSLTNTAIFYIQYETGNHRCLHWDDKAVWWIYTRHIGVGLAVTPVHPHGHYHFRVPKNTATRSQNSENKVITLSSVRCFMPCGMYSLRATESQSALILARDVSLRTLIPAAIINNNKGTKNIIQTMTSVDIARNVKEVQSLSVRDTVLLFSTTLTAKNAKFSNQQVIILIIWLLILRTCYHRAATHHDRVVYNARAVQIEIFTARVTGCSLEYFSEYSSNRRCV